jgi:catechol 2,3-dioxygenase-like lactoylglutathione lyase family enzyme
MKPGPIDRRELLRVLGVTGAASLAGACARPETARAETGQAAAPTAGQAGAPSGESNSAGGKPRFAWNKTYGRIGQFKTISVGHVSYSVPEQRKTRDWYVDVLGMMPVFDTGRSTALRFGVPWNHIYLGQAQDPKAKPTIGHISYNIEKFRLDAVEAELIARGLPHRYDGPEMIHTDDPEGYRVQPASLVAIFPGGGNAENVENLGEEDGLKQHLRQAPRPNYATLVASCMNHISHNCVDYGKVRDYYIDLWGMRKVADDGKVAVVEFGGLFGDPPQQIWLRGGLKPGQKQFVDHIGYSVENFDAAKVEAVLKKRGLSPKAAGPNAWAINDVAGYPIQICAEKGVVPADEYKPYQAT